jgi:UDP-GlcNAc3NAcA epimerase
MKMPEEINRIVTDRISSYLFCPTDTAMNNLKGEGFDQFDCTIIKSGDVMLDSVIMFSEFATKPKVELSEKFILCTIHRQENTDDKVNLTSIINALNEISIDQDVILPLHPRTQKKILEYKLNDSINERLILIDPIGYLEMLYLLKNSSLIITDSGGLQKEAFYFHKLCLTLRNETEWTELVDNGFNIICGTDYDSIVTNYKKIQNSMPDFNINLYGDGSASKLIVETISR